jgi:S1-C subfamily serine protease
MPTDLPSTAPPGLTRQDAEGPRQPRRRLATARATTRRAGPFVAGIAAAFLALVAYGALNPGKPPITIGDVRQAVASALASVTPPPARGELIYATIQPSLVVIRADTTGADGAPTRDIGSGVIVNDAGIVLTALHVVEHATSITLLFGDGSSSAATIVTSQPDKDIAVLEPATPPSSFAPAVLGNPASMRIGSEAFVVGTPFGLAGSLSAGVVSGLDRSFTDPDTKRTFGGLIQVDAAINPGNSGGPLLDRDGRVVGIVTALINPTHDDVFIGIGLAVPIDVAGGAAGLPPD